ncbi:hypothetical protein KIF59_01590 [Enterobacter cloacae subsp. cloacae]|nr:hypothetical protein [Enterobacter cloacae subsp. cloacae]
MVAAHGKDMEVKYRYDADGSRSVKPPFPGSALIRTVGDLSKDHAKKWITRP